MRRMWDDTHTLHYDLFDEAAAGSEAGASRQGQAAAAGGGAAQAVVPARQVNNLTAHLLLKKDLLGQADLLRMDRHTSPLQSTQTC